MISETILTSWHLGDYYTRPLKRMERATRGFAATVRSAKMHSSNLGAVLSKVGSALSLTAKGFAVAESAAVAFDLMVAKIGRHAEDTTISIGALLDILKMGPFNSLPMNIEYAKKLYIGWENISKYHAGTAYNYIYAVQSLMPTMNKLGANLAAVNKIAYLLVPTAQLYLGGLPGGQELALRGIVEMLQGSARRTNQFVMRFLGAMHLTSREWDKMIRLHPEKAMKLFMQQLEKGSKAAELLGHTMTNILGGLETTVEQLFRWGTGSYYTWLEHLAGGILKTLNNILVDTQLVIRIRALATAAKDATEALFGLAKELGLSASNAYIGITGQDNDIARRIANIYSDYLVASHLLPNIQAQLKATYRNAPKTSQWNATPEVLKRNRLEEQVSRLNQQQFAWWRILNYLSAHPRGIRSNAIEDLYMANSATAAYNIIKSWPVRDIIYMASVAAMYSSRFQMPTGVSPLGKDVIKLTSALQSLKSPKPPKPPKMKIEVTIKHDKRYADKVAVAVFDVANNNAKHALRTHQKVLFTGGY